MVCLAVVGASGRTGREVLTAAIAHGHRVIAIARDPAKLADVADIEIRRGDVLDSGSFAGVFSGVDAVISALGPDDGRRPTQVYSRGMRVIIEEMRRQDVRRVVAVSAVPVSPPADKTIFERLVLHPILWRFFGPSYRDLRVMESELAVAGGISWAVVRPPLLTDAPSEGGVRSAWNQPLRGARKVSRFQLARTLVDTATAEPFRTGVLTITQASSR